MADVTYGSRIKLEHISTDHALHSHEINYSHSGSSRQQMVTAFANRDDNDFWFVKGPHGTADDHKDKEVVQNGDIIRLEHLLSARNLHSHGNYPSPLTGQQEVTAFGELGKGDGNDNWKVEVKDGGKWQSNKRIRLIHVNTNCALHSHSGHSHAQLTVGQQEVTAYKNRDDNDWWSAFEVKHVGSAALARDNPILRQALGQTIKNELSKYNSEDNAWFNEGKETEDIKVIGKKIGSITNETKTWLWLDNPNQHLHIDFYRFIFHQSSIRFSLTATGKAQFKAWGKIPNVVTGDVKGSLRAHITIEGSARISGTRLTKAKIDKLDSSVSDVRFNSELLALIQGLIKDVLNGYIERKTHDLKSDLEKVINNVAF
jgi:hypothetical protein